MRVHTLYLSTHDRRYLDGEGGGVGVGPVMVVVMVMVVARHDFGRSMLTTACCCLCCLSCLEWVLRW